MARITDVVVGRGGVTITPATIVESTGSTDAVTISLGSAIPRTIPFVIGG